MGLRRRRDRRRPLPDHHRLRAAPSAKNQIFYHDLTKPDAKVVELITGFDAEYDFIGNDGPMFWFRTDLDAPRERVIIAIDIGQPGPRAIGKRSIPQAEEMLEGVSVVGDRFLADYLQGRPARRSRSST